MGYGLLSPDGASKARHTTWHRGPGQHDVKQKPQRWVWAHPPKRSPGLTLPTMPGLLVTRQSLTRHACAGLAAHRHCGATSPLPPSSHHPAGLSKRPSYASPTAKTVQGERFPQEQLSNAIWPDGPQLAQPLRAAASCPAASPAPGTRERAGVPCQLRAQGSPQPRLRPPKPTARGGKGWLIRRVKN